MTRRVGARTARSLVTRHSSSRTRARSRARRRASRRARATPPRSNARASTSRRATRRPRAARARGARRDVGPVRSASPAQGSLPACDAVDMGMPARREKKITRDACADGCSMMDLNEVRIRHRRAFRPKREHKINRPGRGRTLGLRPARDSARANPFAIVPSPVRGVTRARTQHSRALASIGTRPARRSLASPTERARREGRSGTDRASARI